MKTLRYYFSSIIIMGNNVTRNVKNARCNELNTTVKSLLEGVESRRIKYFLILGEQFLTNWTKEYSIL